MGSDSNRFAKRLFAPLASDYDRWSALLSLGQDPRWRRRMVRRLALRSGSHVLDVAAGTGMVAAELRHGGCHVVTLDQSPEMLRGAARRGFLAVIAAAESLPFADETFDALTFTYLLRYVSDPPSCMRELARVVKPGGAIGMVEFGIPRGPWRPLWDAYTSVGLPLVSRAISPGWYSVARFLGPSISGFHDAFPDQSLAELWGEAGIAHVACERMSVGGGLVMWGTRQ